jgi:drug/metabolite transporter superfamily protein YnfA
LGPFIFNIDVFTYRRNPLQSEVMGAWKEQSLRLWRWVRRVDWRVWGIVAAAAVSIVGTVVVYYLDPATHFGAVFSAWVGGLALFLVAGSVVAIVSLVRPENESFDARARILFRRQAGKHIDYIVSKIKEVLEHYSERTVNKITIIGFDPTNKKFRIASNNSVFVRSYLDDVETTYISHLDLQNVTAPPANGLPNRLAYARVAGTPIGVSEEFVSGISRPISCRIDRDGICEVNSMFEFWIQADDESNTHKPRRYTQTLCLYFENLLHSGQAVEIKLTLDGTNWLTERLLPGVSRQVLEIKDVKPGTLAYDYRILAP